MRSIHVVLVFLVAATAWAKSNLAFGFFAKVNGTYLPLFPEIIERDHKKARVFSYSNKSVMPTELLYDDSGHIATTSYKVDAKAAGFRRGLFVLSNPSLQTNTYLEFDKTRKLISHVLYSCMEPDTGIHRIAYADDDSVWLTGQCTEVSIYFMAYYRKSGHIIKDYVVKHPKQCQPLVEKEKFYLVPLACYYGELEPLEGAENKEFETEEYEYEEPEEDKYEKPGESDNDSEIRKLDFGESNLSRAHMFVSRTEESHQGNASRTYYDSITSGEDIMLTLYLPDISEISFSSYSHAESSFSTTLGIPVLAKDKGSNSSDSSNISESSTYFLPKITDIFVFSSSNIQETRTTGTSAISETSKSSGPETSGIFESETSELEELELETPELEKPESEVFDSGTSTSQTSGTGASEVFTPQTSTSKTSESVSESVSSISKSLMVTSANLVSSDTSSVSESSSTSYFESRSGSEPNNGPIQMLGSKFINTTSATTTRAATTKATTTTATVCVKSEPADVFNESKAASVITVWRTYTNYTTYFSEETTMTITVCEEVCLPSTVTVSNETTLTITGECVIPETIKVGSTPKGPTSTTAEESFATKGPSETGKGKKTSSSSKSSSPRSSFSKSSFSKSSSPKTNKSNSGNTSSSPSRSAFGSSNSNASQENITQTYTTTNTIPGNSQLVNAATKNAMGMCILGFVALLL